MSYFHTGIRTIIGAEAFHCPVRDGKEWDHLAMVIRLNRSLPCIQARQPIRRVDSSSELEESEFLIAHRLQAEERHTCIYPTLTVKSKL